MRHLFFNCFALTTLRVYRNKFSYSFTYLSNFTPITFFSSEKKKSDELLFIEKFENMVANMQSMGDISVRSSTNPSRYKDAVFELLRGFKSNPTNLQNDEAL
jgi:hypothetical protein